MNTLTNIILCFFFIFNTNTSAKGGEEGGFEDRSKTAYSNNALIAFYMHNVVNNQPYDQEDSTSPLSNSNGQNYTPVMPDLSLKGRAAAEGLEFGPVTVIDQALYQYLEPGSPVLIGSAQGIYVANSDSGVGYMVAIKASFSNGDGLRFFGAHKVDAPESHIAVIGGTGKYRNANGYASVKTLDLGSNGRPYKLLLFNVHLG